MSEKIPEINRVLVTFCLGHGMLVGIHQRDTLYLGSYPLVNLAHVASFFL